MKYEDLVTKQPTALKILMNGFKNDRLSHAYLFEGDKGTFKYETSIFMAKKLLCYNQHDGIPCDECSVCISIDMDSHPDVKIIDPDGQTIKKEEINILQANFTKTSMMNNSKVYIINDAARMNSSAANSLLKFLEEPEGDVYAFLLVDNIYQLYKTIVSRCQVISFKPIDINETIEKYLELDYRKTESKLASILASSEDNTMLLLEDNFTEKIDAVINFISLLEHRNVFVLVDLPDKWNRYFKTNKDHVLALEILLNFYRDLLNHYYYENLVIFDDYYEMIIEMKELLSIDDVTSRLEIIFESRRKLNSNMNAQLLMEQMIIDMKGGKYGA